MTHAMTGRSARRVTLAALSALPLLAALGCASAPARTPQKIAFVGAGRMGSAIGTLLVGAGHEVMFSSRHPEELKPLVDKLGPHAHAGTVADAVKFGDVIVLTIPYNGMPELAKQFGRQLQAKPLVMDVGNPVPNRDGAVGALAEKEGAGIYVKELMPHLKVVRAFNAISWAKLPEYATRQGDHKVAAPIVGEDPKAIALAESLIRETGFEPVLVGGLAMSQYTAPRGPLADDHTAAEARKIVAGLK
jgi:predicted dinucleotide-binding enzyme